MTFERLSDLVPAERIWIVTTAETAAPTRDLVPEIPVENVLSEPVGRNTAACVGLAAHAALKSDAAATCVVLPADHVIGEEARFRSALTAGAELVTREGGLLTFGVQPMRPETGYGYLELGIEHTRIGDWAIHCLERFVEKPDARKARRYLESGGYLWNAGIFAWRAADLLDEINRQLPELAAGLDAIAASFDTPEAENVLARTYPSLPATSVDFGVMEGARRSWTIPVDFPWSDVGSWSALDDDAPSKTAENTLRGRVVTVDASRNILVSTGPVVAAIGVEDLVVVTTPDAVLVVPKSQSQRVKEVVEALREKGWDDVL